MTRSSPRSPPWAFGLAAGIVLLAATLGGRPAAALVSPPLRTGHVEASLVSETPAAAPGSTFYVALRQEIQPGWHTYWRNPGDAGQATSIAFHLPPGWRAGDIVWPTPERYASGPLMNYVFSREVYLPVPIEVPAGARVGSVVRLDADADWLVCKDVCVPEQGKLSLEVPVRATPGTPDAAGRAVAATLAAAPKPVGLQAAFSRDRAGDVVLTVTGAAVRGLSPAHAYFYPYNGAVLEQSQAQKASAGPAGLTLILPAGYNFTHNRPPATLDGVLDLGGGRAFEVVARPGPPLKGAGSGPFATTTPEAPGGGGGAGAGEGGGLSLPLALLYGLIGGVILNLMPCVFPVLSLKATALARHAESPAAARREAVAYTVGAVATFVLLAALLIAATAAGQAVGWGFQLQSPAVVAVLALLMLAVGLNLSGVFEVGASLQGAGSGAAARGGLVGALATGALAVVVAAPCTAPFMATAIGWALTQPPAAALLVFAALGLGLSAPFLLIAFHPPLVRLLPRPGAWMDLLRRILAFPMYGAAAWLAWVFDVQAGSSALVFLFAAAVILAFAAFLFGASQSGRAAVPFRIAAALALVAAAPLAFAGVSAARPQAGEGSAAGAAVASAGALPVEAWSPERVEALKSAGRPVLVDFTAAWCVTCQVNERTALAAPEVVETFRRTGAHYLKADWTNRNAEIARALSAAGRSGVPLYLLYDGRTPEPRILPQLLTSGAVAAAVEAAAKPSA